MSSVTLGFIIAAALVAVGGVLLWRWDPLLPYLKLATPLFKPSDPPGAITLPATWAAVVQIGYIAGAAWHPGPRLRAWTHARFAERTGWRPAREGDTPGSVEPDDARPQPINLTEVSRS